MAADWSGIVWEAWSDYDRVRARLEAGADPNSLGWGTGGPLCAAAALGSPQVVAELAGRVADVDADCEGITALWRAVYVRRPDNARVLVAAGADPWRPMMAGWSPGRLALAGPTPDLFTRPPGVPGLTEAETAAAVQSPLLVAALGVIDTEGIGLACVAGIDAAEAARRLAATLIEDFDADEYLDDPPYGDDESLAIIGATDVPGGCVLTQPWGFAPQLPGVMTRLSRDTVCYGLYANPKSGDQGSIARDGVIEGADLNPGGDPYADASAEEVLLAYLYRHNAVAYACAYAGLRPADARAITGPADVWLRLPPADHSHA